jgi:anhydro-N-acetylmuramic acid kinase
MTVLDSHGGAIMAFDTGPGNMLMDRACELLLEKPYDENGENARLGRINNDWLKDLSLHPYFQRTPPKTTGREQFGYAFADKEIDQARRRGLSPQDILTTLTALTASTISTAYKEFILPEAKIERLVVGGGGADNAYLLELLAQAFPHPVKISRHEEFGISTKFKEALLFALLAYTTYFGVPNNVPACTGASRRVCLGKIVSLPASASIGERSFPGIGKRR